MNYNDINARLKRIYASISSTKSYGGEVLSGMRHKHIETSKGKFTLSISFGSEEEAQNKIQTVISGLANLKDILKDRMKSKGQDEELIEDEINKSENLKLILDLSNQEKHGYPLDNRRSGRDPLISNIQTGMGISDKPDNITYVASSGAKAHNVMISISADIVDSDGVKICSFDHLVNQAVSDWEMIVKNII